MFNALANLKIVVRVGWCNPRSKKRDVIRAEV